MLDDNLNAPAVGDGLWGTHRAKVTGCMYANVANSIKIKNCNGNGNAGSQIYLRGFCIDGSIGTTTYPSVYDRNEGLVIENSNVVVENCAVMRCNSAGAKFVNSNVILNRGFTAYRMHRLATATTVSSTPAYGLVSYNSDITLSGANDASAGLGVDSPFTFSHSHTGIQLNNSTLRTPWGGRGFDLAGSRQVGSAFANTIPWRQLYLDVMLNTHVGLECNNSKLDMYHSLMVYQNTTGIKATNSNLILDELVCDHNNGTGLKADNSVIEYYRTKHSYYDDGNGPNKILSFLKNGKNMELVNSTFKEPEFSNFKAEGLYNNYEIEGTGYKRTGSTDYKNSNQKSAISPGVTLTNSVCRLMMVNSPNGTSSVDQYASEGTPVLGSAYRVYDNSYLKFMGASAATPLTRIPSTYITGPSSNYKSQLDTVAVFANRNSTVEFNGPAIFTDAGVNVGVNNNSTLVMRPHNEDGVLETLKYNLSDTNMHTKIMDQSYKACFAANNNSTIIMKDCGDYIPYWQKSKDPYVHHDLIVSSTYNPSDAAGITSSVSGGYIQFFPNPIMDGNLSGLPFAPKDTKWSLSHDGVRMAEFPVLDPSNIPVAAAGDADYYYYSQGGYCVKADKGSEVIVKNVHFPCGFLNASSTILDVSAGTSATQCGKTFIWGIGDDSRLHASHIVVSGSYPASAPYHGPSGVYVSAATCDGVYVALSSAPAATEDTGRLSVLDSFGLQPAMFPGTAPPATRSVSATDAVFIAQNRGPFRLYFSVNPVAKFLGYTRGDNGSFQLSSNIDAGYTWWQPGEGLGSQVVVRSPSAVEVGEPYQELAQGYNPSRDCSTPDPRSVSSIHQELAFQNPRHQPLSSTFFYASGMIDNSYVNRIWLDD